MTVLSLDELLAHHGDRHLEVFETLTSESLPSSAVREHGTHGQFLISQAFRVSQHPVSPLRTLTLIFRHTGTHSPYPIGTLEKDTRAVLFVTYTQLALDGNLLIV